uniref:receptor expression-enhancing protein 2 n=1 Tax=Scatophagus argus TaxID=75038 RepID=UPI001ED7ED20|nr:receptor expression-enhancing protein 2 [Scatophagus argus]
MGTLGTLRYPIPAQRKGEWCQKETSRTCLSPSQCNHIIYVNTPKSRGESSEPAPHRECLSRQCYATLPSMDKSYSPLAVYPASRCCLCASRRSRLDAPVIWRKLLPADSASCRLSSAMVSWIISRLVVLVFGTLYPAYSSYKAVKSKDVKEYVKWMMYWIIFALFTTVEVFTDMFLCWLPFYYELKIAFVVWLLSPYTKGSSVLYRKFVHPTLSSKEKEIDDYIGQAKDKSYDTLVHFGRKGLNVAATAAVMAATKGQGVLSDRLRSFSMQDLSSYQSDTVDSGPGTTQPAQPAPAQNRTRSVMRSKSESYNKGQDFDMTEYEVLRLDQWDSKGVLSQTTSPSESESTPITPSLTPQSSLPSTPSPPPTPSAPNQSEEVEKGVQATSSSPQLRLMKRKAPEPPLRVLRPLTRSRSALSSNNEAM